MTPLKTLQTSPTRANQLFAQLAETGPGAVKARERLFDELREELELAARLQHDHLLPALKKQAGTKTVVAATAERLRDLRAQLRRLADAPKAGDAFAEELAELKAAFREHLREEKSALLPKLQKLTDEEMLAVAERFETDRAEIEATAKHEAEVERAAERRRREREEAREAAAEAAEREARRLEREERAAARAAEETAREAVEQTARAVAAPVETVRATAGAGLRVVAEAAERSLEQTAEVVRATGETSRSFAAAARNGTVFALAAQDAQREWMTWAQARLQNQVAGITALMQCRKPADLIELQSRLVREELKLLTDTSARISGAATTAARSFGGQA